jgi:hypothetical protein
VVHQQPVEHPLANTVEHPLANTVERPLANVESSPSEGADARGLPVRDVRDLALAVVEGAVAAEALAQELKRTPDRSRHFQEIAGRLRAVVGRPSIRTALTASEEELRLDVSPRIGGKPSRPSIAKPIESATNATPPSVDELGHRPEDPSGERALPDADPRVSSGDRLASREARADRRTPTDDDLARLARIEKLVGALGPSDEALAGRLARLEEAIARKVQSDDARLTRLEELLSRMANRRDDDERYALRSAEEAIALAARLTERLRHQPKVVVRIEPG